MSVVDVLHRRVFARRSQVLARHIAELLPPGSTCLDVGCGDGTIDAMVRARRPDITIEGIDVLIRPTAVVAVTLFDGVTIPFPDRSFDAVLLVDVLHHTQDPAALLAEATRVARHHVLVKDHVAGGPFSRRVLALMDRVGNERHGVALPYRYLTAQEWSRAFSRLSLEREASRTRLGLYPWPASMVFERDLHFLTRLAVRRGQPGAPEVRPTPRQSAAGPDPSA
jgi:ubiquinone/menaquinone biosynthesis C-methylase UbiE